MMLVLASASLERRRLLEAYLDSSVELRVSPVDVDERELVGESAQACVLRLAEKKARAAWERDKVDEKNVFGTNKGHQSAVIAPSAIIEQKDERNLWLGADTLVEHEGRILGKMPTRERAKEELKKIAGRRFFVHTAMALAYENGRIALGLSSSELYMQDLDESAWENYLDQEEQWKGRAGAFSLAHLKTPVKLLQGEFESVCGISLAWLKLQEPSLNKNRA